MECFDKVNKMVDIVKMIEKHLDIVLQTHQRMRNLQENIIELDEWRSTEKDIPSSLPLVKRYDIQFILWLLKNVKTWLLGSRKMR